MKLKGNRLKILLVTALMIASYSYGQELDLGHSPEVMSFKNLVTSNDQALFHGDPGIGIPLYSFKFGSLDIALNLAYSPNSLKMLSKASRVGWGWSLNTGGQIIRMAKGVPDDYNSNYEDDLCFNAIGYLFPESRSRVDDIASLTTCTDIDAFLEEIEENRYDLQPDIYNISFPGFSGSFVFDENKNIHTIPLSNLIITEQYDSEGRITGFTVIDENGITYTFDEYEASTFVIKKENWSDKDHWGTLETLFRRRYINNWLLTEIEDLNGKKLYFEYDEENVLHFGGGASSNVTEYESKSLKRIYNDDITINFHEYDDGRNDYSGFYALDNIEIFNSYDKVIKRIDFDHSYFPENVSSKEKLKLNSVSVTGKPPYIFSYHDEDQSWDLGADIWGFNGGGKYNDKPKVRIYPEEFEVLDDWHRPFYNTSGSFCYVGTTDRRPTPEEIDFWALSGIILPEGGMINYEWEMHEFYYQNGKHQGGGMRIASQEYIPDVGETILKEYVYQDDATYLNTSGRLLYSPNFTFPLFQPAGCDFYQHQRNCDNGDWGAFIKVSGNDLTETNESNPSTICYRKVEVIEGNKGSTVYEFEIPGLYYDGQGTGDDNLFYKTEIGNTVSCAGSGDVTFCQYLQRDYNDWPYPPNTNFDWARGQISNIIYKDVNGKVLKKVENSYDVIYKDGTTPFIIKGLKWEGTYFPPEELDEFSLSIKALEECMHKFFIPEVCRYCSDDIFDSYPDITFFYGYYDILTDLIKVPSETVIKTYDPDHPGDDAYALTETVTYAYNNLGQLINESKVGSDGIVTETVIEYPTNFDFSSDPTYSDEEIVAIKALQDLNVISIPLKTDVFIDEQIYSSSLTTFKQYGGLYLPDKTYSFQSQVPQSEVGWFNILKTYPPEYSFEPDVNLKEVFSNVLYDARGNILQQNKKDDIDISYIWGYNQTLPIAKIDNARYGEIFFDGMEEDNGRWADNWNECNISYITDKKHTGRYSLKTYSSDDCWNISEYLFLYAQEAITLKLSGWVYSTGANARILIIWTDAEIPGGDMGTEGTNWDAESAYINLSKLDQWQYVETTIDIPSHAKWFYIRLDNEGSNQNVWFDDIRVHPVDAQMTTYTHEPLVGITSETDPNSKTKYYNYDNFGQLTMTKLNDEILEEYNYNYKTPYIIGISKYIYTTGLNFSKYIHVYKNLVGNILVSSNNSDITASIVSETSNYAQIQVSNQKYREGAITISATDNVGNTLQEHVKIDLRYGLKADYYDDLSMSDFVGSYLEDKIDHRWILASPQSAMHKDQFSIRWSGHFIPRYSDTYTVSATVDDGVRVSVNGVPIINDWNDGAERTVEGSIYLTANQLADLEIEYYENGGKATIVIVWKRAGDPNWVFFQGENYITPLEYMLEH